MAHAITDQDNFAFTGNRDRIWHRLGQQIPEGLSAEDAFPLVGLDWETELEPVYYKVKGKEVELTENRVHVRKDTGAPLGLVSDGYKPIDNGDLAKFADHLLGADAAASISTCGSLLGGKRVFALLQMPKSFEVVKGDGVETYILLSNGHGGFASFNVYPTSIRVVCDNTLSWSERDLGRGVRFHHTGDLDAKLEQARVIMGLAVREAELFEEQVRALANKDLSKGQIRDFMRMAFVASFGKSPDKETQPEAHERWTVRYTEHVKDWIGRMDNEQNSLPGIQGTAWSALNAYTQWSDHDRGGKWMESRPHDHRVHSNLFGVAASAKKKMLTRALQLAR
jgi:phage/plasmid-like protein (TIGR03299 family)